MLLPHDALPSAAMQKKNKVSLETGIVVLNLAASRTTSQTHTWSEAVICHFMVYIHPGKVTIMQLVTARIPQMCMGIGARNFSVSS